MAMRRRLDATLFPDAPEPSPITGRRVLGCMMLGALAVILQLARVWTTTPLDSMWAEDGGRWLPDAIHLGFLDALTTTYNGYLQSTSRLIATPVSWLPVRWYAPAMAVSGALIVTACAFVVWRAAAGQIRRPALRAALALTMVVLPIAATDTIANVTNSIWFMAFASFWVLLWRPSSVARAVLAGVFIALATLSNAATLILLPVWALRVLASRDRRDTAIVTGFGMGGAIQVACSWGAPLAGDRGARLSPAVDHLLAPRWDWGVVPAYFQRVVGGSIMGQRIDAHLWNQFGVLEEWAFALGLATLVVIGCRKLPRARWLAILTVSASIGFALAEGYLRYVPFGGHFLWSPNAAFVGPDAHYLVVPALLLLSALVVLLDGWVGRVPQRLTPRLAIALSGVMLGIVAVSFDVGDRTVRGSPRWSVAVARARITCHRTRQASIDVPTSPRSALGQFTMRLSCKAIAA